MATTLHPDEHYKLAALLAYCREMGNMDFFRGAGDSAVASLSGKQISEVVAPAIAPIAVSTERTTDMPRTSGTTLSAPVFDVSAAAIPPKQRAAALHAIQQEIGDCTRCPLAFEGRNTIVFGNGDPNAELLFVGEGPGADEDAQGLPFVGRCGQLLNNMIAAMGLQREQVYVANIVKCRPPKNRVPEPIEANTCSPFLFQQIGVVRPKLIVALGATAATYLLGSKAALSVLRGRVHDCMGTKLVVSYHPAYLLRDPRQKAEAWKDLQLAMKLLKMAPPKRTGDPS